MSDSLKHERNLAGKSPSQIKLTAVSRNGYLVILMILFPISLLVLGGYIFDRRQGFWIILSFGAVFLSFIGFYQTIIDLAKIEIEIALTKIIENAGKHYLEGDGKNDRDELDDLPARLSVLSEKKESNPAMNRLILHVIGEAKSNKYDSEVNLIQNYKDESLDIIFTLQNYQKIALWIGIAGTFVGILGAMQSADFDKILKDGRAEEFVKLVPLMLDGLVISFSASLAGLVSAIVIGCLILITRRKQQIYFQEMEKVVNFIVRSARKSKNKNQFLSEIDALRKDVDSQVGSFREDLTNNQILTKELQNSIYEMQKRIVLQNGHIQESVNKFFESNEKLNGFARKTESELKGIYDAIALKTTLQDSISFAGQQMSDTLSKQLTEMTAQMNQFQNSANQFSQTVEFHNQILKKNNEQVTGLNKNLDLQLGNLSSAIRNLRLPQNLSLWVIGLAVFLGLCVGFILFR